MYYDNINNACTLYQHNKEKEIADMRMTIAQYIEANQPEIYKKLKRLYPLTTRIITDEREYVKIKSLMEERRGVKL